MGEQITTAAELDARGQAAHRHYPADRGEVALSAGAVRNARLEAFGHGWDARAAWDRPDAPVAAGATVTAEQAWGEAAGALEQLAADTYPEDVFIKPSRADYEAINALLHRERGHYLDGIAADCYRRALTVGARHLREQAEDRALTALGLTVADGPSEVRP